MLTFWPLLSGNKLTMEDADAENRKALETASRIMIFIAKSGLQRTKEFEESGIPFRICSGHAGWRRMPPVRLVTGSGCASSCYRDFALST